MVSACGAPLPPPIKASGRLHLLPSTVVTASLPLVNIPGCTPPPAANVGSVEAKGATPTDTRGIDPLITKKSPPNGSGIASESIQVTSKLLGDKSIPDSSIAKSVAGSSVPRHILMAADRPVPTLVSMAATQLPSANILGRTLPTALGNVGSNVLPATAKVTSAKAVSTAPSVPVAQVGDTKTPLPSSLALTPILLEREKATLDKEGLHVLDIHKHWSSPNLNWQLRQESLVLLCRSESNMCASLILHVSFLGKPQGCGIHTI